jgi:hypothetical protein
LNYGLHRQVNFADESSKSERYIMKTSTNPFLGC